MATKELSINDVYLVIDEVNGSDDECSAPASGPAARAHTAGPAVLEGASDMDIDSDSQISSTEPFLKISFRNTEIAYKYKSKILNSILRVLPRDIIVKDSLSATDLELWEKEEDLLLFTTDTEPDSRANYCRAPRYEMQNELVLKDEAAQLADSKQKQKFSNVVCFNCEGSHGLRDCPRPKDFTAINRNRVIYQSKQSRGANRYHLDENQKFSHIKPGQFSKSLRKALNIKKDELPFFIYNMRNLGYPPGWMEEAKITHSGVLMYDKKGSLVLEENEEEGEIIPEGAKDKYDVSKIIDFPGFNVKPSDEYKDLHRNFNCPSMSEEQSKEAMINALGPNAVTSYTKKSFNLPTASAEETRASPTIEEMEEKKRKLLEQLNSDDEVTETNTTPIEFKQRTGPPKVIDFGTPVLKSVSPYARIPQREKFSVDICDVINFENLPDSTGKYETMAHLISKIRKVASQTPSE